MPYKNVSDARERVPALKKLSTHQVQVWVAVFNSLAKKGVAEERIFPQAMAAAKRASEKALKKSLSYDNLKEQLETFVKEKYVPAPQSGELRYFEIEDFDNQYVFFKIDDAYFRVSYSVDGADKVSIGNDKVEMIEQVVFIEKSVDVDDSQDEIVDLTEEELQKIFDSVETEIEKSLIEKVIKSVKEFFVKEVALIKQFDEEKMQAVEVMYVPDNVDAHEHAMTKEQARKMVDSFNSAIQKGKLKGNLCHAENTQSIEPLKAWITECDCRIGDTYIPEGWPLVKVQFHDKELWELRKAGVLMGVSIGARGKLVPNPKYKEE